jgi:diguanylate cyclase (GGDEF)-like protein
MPTCWHCERAVPEDGRYCPSCGYDQQDRRSAPLFVIDPVTGLLNGAFVTALTAQEVVRAGRYQRPLAVLVATLDSLDLIRQDAGEAGLGRLMHETGQVLTSSIRETDTVAFLDADDYPRFVVVMPETDRDGAMRAAEKLRGTVAAHEYRGSTQWRRLTISCGVAIANPHRSGPQDLIADASAAMLDRLGEGPNRTHARFAL